MRVDLDPHQCPYVVDQIDRVVGLRKFGETPRPTGLISREKLVEERVRQNEAMGLRQLVNLHSLCALEEAFVEDDCGSGHDG